MAALEYSDRVVLLAILKIPNGSSDTLAYVPVPNPKAPEAKFVSGEALANYDSLLIITTEAALTGVVTVKVLADNQADAAVIANYATLQSPPGTDVAIAANKAIALGAVPFPAIALQSAAAEAGTRVFRVYGVRKIA